jgi:hypothetical protein
MFCHITIALLHHEVRQSKGLMGDLLKAMYGAFEEARSNAPSILFIDEIDAIGDREKFSGDNAQYCTEVVNGLLEYLDGADGREGVVIVGACNHPHRLDAAITRPGICCLQMIVGHVSCAAWVGSQPKRLLFVIERMVVVVLPVVIFITRRWRRRWKRRWASVAAWSISQRSIRMS